MCVRERQRERDRERERVKNIASLFCWWNASREFGRGREDKRVLVCFKFLNLGSIYSCIRLQVQQLDLKI